MAEGSSEKQRLSRRRFLKTAFWGGLAALGLSQAPRVMRGIEEYRWDPTRPENLKELFGTETPLPLNFKRRVRSKEGASFYKKPRREEKPSSGVITVPTTGSTRLGTLEQGEEVVAEKPFLFLQEANPSVPEDLTVNIQGRRLDKRGWIVFSIKGANLPGSVRGDSPYGLACVPIEAPHLEFTSESGEESEMPKTEDINIGEKIDFGRVI